MSATERIQKEIDKLDARISCIEVRNNEEKMRKFESLYQLRQKLIAQKENANTIHFAF